MCDALDRLDARARAGGRGLLRRRGEARRPARSTSSTDGPVEIDPAARAEAARAGRGRGRGPGRRAGVSTRAAGSRWPRSRCTSASPTSCREPGSTRRPTPRCARDAAKLAVIGTGKRTGKTAVAGHWAALLRERGADPVMVCMGRGGPAEPRSAPAGIGPRRAARDRRPRRARGLRLPRGRGAGGRAHRRLPARGRRPRGRARRVERGRRGGSGGVDGSRGDRVRGLRRLHPAGGRGSHGVRARGRAPPSRSRSTGSSGPTSCWPPRARRRRPAARCPSRWRPEPAEPLPDGRAVALFTTGRGALRGGGAASWRPPTWRAARRARRGPRPRRRRRAATSTSRS